MKCEILNNTELTSTKHKSKTIVIMFARLRVIISCVVVSIFVVCFAFLPIYVRMCVCVSGNCP